MASTHCELRKHCGNNEDGFDATATRTNSLDNMTEDNLTIQASESETMASVDFEVHHQLKRLCDTQKSRILQLEAMITELRGSLTPLEIYNMLTKSERERTAAITALQKERVSSKRKILEMQQTIEDMQKSHQSCVNKINFEHAQAVSKLNAEQASIIAVMSEEHKSTLRFLRDARTHVSTLHEQLYFATIKYDALKGKFTWFKFWFGYEPVHRSGMYYYAGTQLPQGHDGI
ncbi:hypothetical protein BC830DRAFT_295797 [Chytriomyces sp. MP71]|nr:hypothetical protein BC830DRAFT_295797 [Chytriomyces sp. MP71]